MDRCVKNFLDTALYPALKERHSIHIFSYLSDQEDFRDTYGGDAVEFHPSPKIRSGWRGRAYRLSEILGYFGYFYRWRKGLAKVYWTALTKYKTEDYFPQEAYKPRTLRHWALAILGVLGSTS